MTLTTLRGRAREGLDASRARAADSVESAGNRARKGMTSARKRANRRIRDTRRTVGYRIAGERRPSTARRLGITLAAGATGAALAFFLDPVSGKRRRHLVRDKVVSTFRGARERAARRRRYMQGQAEGRVKEARRAGAVQVPENDRVLVDKVESEAIGYSGVPSGRVNVNAESGVVILRGQVESPDDVVRLEKLVREVDGVRGVENLLHTPGTSAPNTSG
jgi:osmotically-inducible protein OsmY